MRLDLTIPVEGKAEVNEPIHSIPCKANIIYSGSIGPRHSYPIQFLKPNTPSLFPMST